MAPHRPLSDLCIIAVVKQLKPADQLKASRMSPRCSRLVRAANRRVRSLVITNFFNCKIAQPNFRWSYFPPSPSMQQWIEDVEHKDSGKIVNYHQRKEIHITVWNSLQLNESCEIILPTVEEVVTVLFSAITNLTYIECDSGENKFEYLIALLQHPQWVSQLVSLTVDMVQVDFTMAHPVFTAINSLTALQHLAIMGSRDNQIPDLPILARLKVISMYRGHLPSLLASLERHAPGNADLQMHFETKNDKDEDALIALSEPLRSRIVHLDVLSFKNLMRFLGGQQFSSLTSLDAMGFSSLSPPQMRTLFPAISQLPQLVHLRLNVDLSNLDAVSPRLLTQLNSVRALDLLLRTSSHAQVEWLNLHWTLPHCQAIYLEWNFCHSCGIGLSHYSRELSSTNELAIVRCLRAIFSKLHAGVPANRIALSLTSKQYRTAEDIFASCQ